MSVENDIFDARIQSPFCLIVCGPSMSGKTFFVTELLKNSPDLINPPPDNITWFYGINTSGIQTNNLKYPHINFVEGLPESFDKYIDLEKQNLFIFDDLMIESVNDKNVTELFTRKSHHMNTSVILILQDIFYHGSERKTFIRNAQYLTLFSNPLDQSSIYAVANKIMPKRVAIFFKIFEAVTKRPHGYLFIDGRQTTPAYARLRTDIFKGYQRVFIPKL